jgi:hypothetical protein
VYISSSAPRPEESSPQGGISYDEIGVKLVAMGSFYHPHTLVAMEPSTTLVAMEPSSTLTELHHAYKMEDALRMLACLRDSGVNDALMQVACMACVWRVYGVCMACSGQSAPSCAARPAQPAQCYTLGHGRAGGGGGATKPCARGR